MNEGDENKGQMTRWQRERDTRHNTRNDMNEIYRPSPDNRVRRGKRGETKTEKRKDQEEISSGLYQM